MADVTVIGKGAFIRGHIRGDGDLEIQGRVEGDVEVEGEVTIGDGALVRADVSARLIVVRGAVAGNLTAQQAVRLEDGARVVGDLRAARIGVAQGALVRGHVQTGDAPAAKRGTGAARAVRSEPKAAARSEAGAPLRAVRRAPAATKSQAAAAAKAEKAAPPPPLVPALRRGARGALKKKRGAH